MLPAGDVAPRRAEAESSRPVRRAAAWRAAISSSSICTAGSSVSPIGSTGTYSTTCSSVSFGTAARRRGRAPARRPARCRSPRSTTSRIFRYMSLIAVMPTHAHYRPRQVPAPVLRRGPRTRPATAVSGRRSAWIDARCLECLRGPTQAAQRVAQRLAAHREGGRDQPREARADPATETARVACGIRRTTVESTAGGGLKAPRPTSNSGSTRQAARASRSAGHRSCRRAPRPCARRLPSAA